MAMTTAYPLPEGPAAQLAGLSFEQLAAPLRREIKLHCYRMLGSLHEAEDLVQDTYLRAWRSFASFEGGSFRAWLYKIATNACLSVLASRKRAQRWLPEQLGPPTVQPLGSPALDVAWLEPYPDAELDGIADEQPTPEGRYASRQAVQLAFVAALQQLPPRQRAALMLCDVLGWSSAEAAALLGGSMASINSALQRSRETLSRRFPDGSPSHALPPSPQQQELLGRYVAAWERHDVDGFVALIKEDASLAMPPWAQWYQGREAIRAFFASAWAHCGGVRLLPCSANGQPAFAVYERSAVGAAWEAHAIHALALQGDLIGSLTAFLPPTGPALFSAFGLPLVLAAG